MTQKFERDDLTEKQQFEISGAQDLASGQVTRFSYDEAVEVAVQLTQLTRGRGQFTPMKEDTFSSDEVPAYRIIVTVWGTEALNYVQNTLPGGYLTSSLFD